GADRLCPLAYSDRKLRARSTRAVHYIQLDKHADQPRRLCYVHRGFSARCPVIADRIVSMTPRPRPCPAVPVGLRNQLAKTDCLAIGSARRRMQRWRLGARPTRNAAKSGSYHLPGGTFILHGG